jgi:hypothetical protein
LRKRLA